MKVPLVAGSILLVSLSRIMGAEKAPDFNHDIKPILSENCYACHGPDPNKRKAELRLDRVEVATGKLPSGKVAIVPGRADQSELLHRLTTEDAADRMPPSETGKRLTAAQVDLLRRWIAAGAPWGEHWAYRPLRKVDPPAVPAGQFVHNDIDRFILARLTKENLQPAPSADGLTLMRRLSFDLTGLPPSMERVDAFTQQGYEHVVDELLASPEYGERMAGYWLDLVRYADTCGYHGDQHINISPYRDYVIEAFNQNVPFDRFTIEQLAGDLLPEATVTQRIASGYNRLLMTTEEGGAQTNEYRAKYAADRVRNASAVWLGATMGCCECHDHKFDPFTTADFYSFAAFFADVQEIAVGKQEATPVPTPSEETQLERLRKKLKPIERELNTQTRELEYAQAAWEETQFQWSILSADAAVSSNGTFLELQDDETIKASGKNPETETYAIKLRTELKDITAFRLEVIPDDKLPNDGPGRYDSGNFVLSELEVYSGTEKVPLGESLATFAQDKFPAANAVDGKPDTGWAIGDKHGQYNYAVFQSKNSLGSGASLELTFLLHQKYGSANNLGRFRISATTIPWPNEEAGPQPPPANVADILALASENRTDQQKDVLSGYYRGFAPLLEPLRKERTKVQSELNVLSTNVTHTLMTRAGPPRPMRILPRGNWLSEDGAIVEPAVPGFLPSLDVTGRRATRLDLAKWMTATNNPLVSRVLVNRLWKLMFGRGIVKSLEDFGSQGTPPTQPELLDWLAREFIDSGWDIKHMVKLMAMSGAYRQSSQPNATLRERDPYNDLFARQSRFRLDAEMVRDNALEVSSLLVRQVGGRSVKPYQPAGYWAYLNFPLREYQNDRGENLYRRSLYTYWCRTYLHPSLAAFDAPTREECTAERIRSNTPQQAMVLLNDPIYVEAARVLAELLIRYPRQALTEKVDYAYRRVLGRLPQEKERAVLLDLYQKHLAEYRADPAAAKELLKEGDWPLLQDIDRSEMAAWTSVTRVLLNLNETIVRR